MNGGINRQEGGILDANMWGLGRERRFLVYTVGDSVTGEAGAASGDGGDTVGDRQVGCSEHDTSSLSEPRVMG